MLRMEGKKGELPMSESNGRIRHLLVFEQGESDEVKVGFAVALRSAAMWYDQEGTGEAEDMLVKTARDCLRGLLGREPTGKEVWQVVDRAF
jgi:hypothetical protein